MLEGTVHFDGEGKRRAGGPARQDLRQHRAHYGMGTPTAEELLAAIAAVELTGRGGGHFPVVRKLSPLITTAVDAVVVNGSEGEVLSAKDAALLQLRPHLVLDGAQALARVTRARRVVVWLHDGADASLASIQSALSERQGQPDHVHDRPVQVMLGPARYLTGEASSVIAGVRGEPVLPRFIADPSRPWVDGEPVLVHNVETHARVGLLLHVGVEQYTPTSLVTIAVNDRRRVVEVAPGTTFAALFDAERLVAPAAVLLGGYGGSWFPWWRLADEAVDPAHLRDSGISFGTGIIAVPPQGRTPAAWSADILDWMAAESAGQCGPCIYGLPELAREYRSVVSARRPGSRATERLHETMQLIEGRGACRHPDGAIRMARSALHLAGEEGQHARARK